MNSIDLLNSMRGGEGLAHFADRLEARLTPIGALNLLGVATRIAPEQEAIAFCDAFLGYHSIGHPIASFINAYDDAKWHASYASPVERKAYCFAHYQAMTPSHQVAFQEHILGDWRAAS